MPEVASHSLGPAEVDAAGDHPISHDRSPQPAAGPLVGVANVSLRAVTLASKFGLTFYLAAYLPPSDLGTYGLVGSSLILVLYAVGLDFYAYSGRELLGRDPADRPRLIRDQAVFHLLSYPVFLPVVLVPFALGWLPWSLLGWVVCLALLEHLSQEAYRLLVILSRPLLANAALFLRSAAWVYAVIAAGVLLPEARSLDWVWPGWVAGNLAALLLAARGVRALAWSGIAAIPIDWAWIRRGIGVGGRLLVGSLAIAMASHLDRYVIAHFHGAEAVGYYTFYWGVAYAVYVFAYNGATMLLYPALVTAAQRGDRSAEQRALRRLGIGSTSAAAALALAAGLGILPALQLLQRADYAAELSAFWVLLGASFLMVLADVPHFGLYARGRDRAVVACSCAGLVAALVAGLVLIPPFGLLGAAWAALATRATVMVTRTLALLAARTRPGAGAARP